MKKLVWLCAFTLAGCVAETNNNVPADTSAALPPPTTSDASPADTPPSTTPEWTVRPDGAGNVRIGMSLAQLAPHMTAADTARIGGGCGYLMVADAPDSTSFMVDGRRLVRIDVRGGRTATAEGARVGDEVSRIMQLYPQARRMPHKYTDGSYLIVIPNAPADTLHRYVFETDGKRVTKYRAGVFPQVEWVEGCS